VSYINSKKQGAGHGPQLPTSSAGGLG